MAGYLAELGLIPQSPIRAGASEDFALIAQAIPSAYFYLSAGGPGCGTYGAHHPQVVFREDVLPLGAAGLAHCALRWLAEGHPL